MKICASCKTEKPNNCYSLNDKQLRKLDCYCRDCRNLMHRKYRKTLAGKMASARYRESASRKIVTKKYRESIKGKATRKRENIKKKKDSKHYNLYKNIKGLVFKAISRGKIQKLSCCICQNSKSEAHHNDYNKPLELMWLCKKHHACWHRLFIPEYLKKGDGPLKDKYGV